jgi:hypothetical protein
MLIWGLIMTDYRKYFFIFFALTFLLSGCMSYTTLQSPNTLNPGKAILGAGTALPISDNEVKFYPEINARIGLFNHFDIGAKYSAPSLFFFDGKYQIIEDPLYLSADLGWSYFSYAGGIAGSKGTFTAWYPMIIAGQDHWYAAVKEVYGETQGEVDIFGLFKFSSSGWISTNVTVGGIIGTNVRLLPELNFIIPKEGKVLFVPAFGLQFAL